MLISQNKQVIAKSTATHVAIRLQGKQALFLGENMLGRKEVDFPTQVQTKLKIRMMKDDLIFIDYEDDSASAANKLQATVYYTFIDRPLNG